jgi:hypothetical protein
MLNQQQALRPLPQQLQPPGRATREALLQPPLQ